MRKIIAALVFVSSAVCADDFSVRFADGEAAEAAEGGAAFQQALAPFIRDALVHCAPPGNASMQENVGQFSFVGVVNGSGSLQDVEVRPATAMSSCFIDQMRRSSLPHPPVSERWPLRYPVASRITVTS